MFCQVWCSNTKPQSDHMAILTDPHSPAKYRFVYVQLAWVLKIWIDLFRGIISFILRAELKHLPVQKLGNRCNLVATLITETKYSSKPSDWPISIPALPYFRKVQLNHCVVLLVFLWFQSNRPCVKLQRICRAVQLSKEFSHESRQEVWSLVITIENNEFYHIKLRRRWIFACED